MTPPPLRNFSENSYVLVGLGFPYKAVKAETRYVWHTLCVVPMINSYHNITHKTFRAETKYMCVFPIDMSCGLFPYEYYIHEMRPCIIGIWERYKRDKRCLCGLSRMNITHKTKVCVWHTLCVVPMREAWVLSTCLPLSPNVAVVFIPYE